MKCPGCGADPIGSGTISCWRCAVERTAGNLPRQREIAERLTELDGYRDRNDSLSLTDAGECAELGIELARMLLEHENEGGEQ